MGGQHPTLTYLPEAVSSAAKFDKTKEGRQSTEVALYKMHVVYCVVSSCGCTLLEQPAPRLHSLATGSRHPRLAPLSTATQSLVFSIVPYHKQYLLDGTISREICYSLREE